MLIANTSTVSRGNLYIAMPLVSINGLRKESATPDLHALGYAGFATSW